MEVKANFYGSSDPEIEEYTYKAMEEFPMEQEFYLAIFRCNKSNYWHVYGLLFDTKEQLIKAMRANNDIADVKIITVVLPVMSNSLSI
jgi:hypothetical protein